MTELEVKSGGCLCGGVRYQLTAPFADVINCHCGQCRKTTGHYVASTTIPNDRFELLESDTLSWYSASPIARRGFCGVCGSNLFWEPVDEERTSIWAGTIDDSSGIKSAQHIYVNFKGDYYEISDGLPCSDG